jgi:hypothetical protein
MLSFDTGLIIDSALHHFWSVLISRQNKLRRILKAEYAEHVILKAEHADVI